MRKTILLAVGVVAMLAAMVGCSYDDEAIWNEIENVKDRVETLEESVIKTNEDIAALQTIVNALQKSLYVVSVTPTAEGYITNTNYTLNQLYMGVKSEAGNSFGGNWTGLTEDAWLKIVAQGFDDVAADAYAEPVSEVEFYLVNGLNVVEDWQKWDLSSLGTVAKVRFNFLYSEEMGGRYGFTIPGYFAYDDVAVRFDK